MSATDRFGPNRHDDLFVSLDGHQHLGKVDHSHPTNLIGDTPSDFENDSESAVAWNYIGLAVSKRRITAFFVGVLVCVSLIFARVAQMQVIDGQHYRNLADGNRTRIEWVPSERGVIYDRQGRELVRNNPRFNLTVTPSDLPYDQAARQQIILRLADLLEIGPIEIENRLNADRSSAQAVVVAEGLDHQKAVLAAIESANTGAVQLSVDTQRYYEFTDELPSLSHVLGYLGRVTEREAEDQPERSLPTDMIGKTGLEKTYERQLRGYYGQRRVEIDAVGRRKEVVFEETGVDGHSLRLALDLDAQRAAETFLRDSLELYGKERGSMIVMKPDTGEVLALVSWPGFDANDFSSGISLKDYQSLISDPNRPLFPRAIGASLPSGSTFKLAVAAAALDTGLVSRWTSVLSTGGISVSIWNFPDWKAGGHGPTNVIKAIAESVNTYFYAVGGGWGDIVGLGAEKMMEYAARFGLGSPTGIDLPGEGSGFLPSKEWKEEVKGERWYIGDTYHLAIGQGDLLVTPVQIAAMTAAFANYGHRVTPRLVQALVGDDGQEISTLVAPSQEKLASDEAIKVVREGMRQAVTVGSARSLSLLPVEAAAKTGTAQWGRNKSPHAWFTSFAPYDEPELVVTVMIEEGEGGSISAAPVARRFYDWWYSGRPDLAEYGETPWYWSAPAVDSEETEPAEETEGDSAVEPSEPETGAVAP